jgi:hypothetical protein
MSIHPDIAITLAAQRVAEYHRLAASRPASSVRTSRPRQLIQALARAADRQVRSLRVTRRTAQLGSMPVASLRAE